MKLEKWRTSVIGVGPWIVSDNEDIYSRVIGQFRLEPHADIFIAALKAQSADCPACNRWRHEFGGANYCANCGKKIKI